jgi:hypothetical protein
VSAPNPTESELSLKHLLGDKYHPLQPELILAKEYEVCAVGGMGAGKTYAACVAAIRHAAKFPGARVLIARFTYKELIESTKHQFFEIVKQKGLQKYFVKPRVWDVREGTNYARMSNGSEFFFTNLDKSIDKHKNVEYSFIFIDQVEEIEFDVYQILLLRCRLTAAPASERHVVSVGNDEGDNWIRQRFLTYEAPHGRPSLTASRKLVRGSALENPHLDEGIRAQYLMLPPEMQRRYVYALMEAGSSRLLPGWRIVEPFDIPGHWPRWVGIDPARSSGVTAALWVTVNPDKEAWKGVNPNAPHFYAEYWAEGRDAELHADAIRQINYPYNPRAQIMDRTSWSASFMSKKHGSISVADLYVQAGLPVVPSQGDEWARVMLYINAHRRGLTVSQRCTNLIRQGPSYRLKGQIVGDSGNRALKIASKSSFHAVDAGGYALSLIPTKVVAVDIREIRQAFDIADGLDEGSYRHWEEFRRTLPMRKGNESIVTPGYDDELQDTDRRDDTDMRNVEDEIW